MYQHLVFLPGKQGLLLPARLPEIIPLVKRALVYDEPQGYASVGAHIRDAACYVVWTFARAYDPEVFEPYVPDIAPSLVIVFCLDREVSFTEIAEKGWCKPNALPSDCRIN